MTINGDDDYRRDADYYGITERLISLLSGSPHPEGDQPLEMFEQFGSRGYVAYVYREHVEHLQSLQAILQPVGTAFNYLLIQRWSLVNDLLIEAWAPSDEAPQWLRDEARTLASLACYPLLEEVARLVARRWTEDGFLTSDPPADVEFRQRKKDGGWKLREYRNGESIVQLSHKLKLMKSTLVPSFQASLDKLDEIVNRPRIQGLEQEHVSLFERLQYSRDVWSHGQRWKGVDAIWVSLLIALLYFRLPPLEPAALETDIPPTGD